MRGELSITYGELMKRAESVAGQLSRQGCQRHDVIGIFAPNCIDWVVVCLAAMRIGATAAGVNALLTAGVIIFLYSVFLCILPKLRINFFMKYYTCIHCDIGF